MRVLISVLILLAVALVVASPALTIWSLNTLFPVLAIPLTAKTYSAAAFLFGMFTLININVRKD